MDFPNPSVEQAFLKAKNSLPHAYAPYSHFHVSASLKIKGKDIYVQGVNVENTSYGATICAERTAIVSLIAQHGYREEIEFLLLCTSPSTTPCALCRQVLIEFGSKDMPIYSTSPEKGLEKIFTLGELLPHSFDKDEFERVRKESLTS